MGEIAEGARNFIALCANCKHPKVRHMKSTFHDEQRQTMSSTKAANSECLECKQQDKQCLQFKPSD